MLRYPASPLLGKMMRNPPFYRACPSRVAARQLSELKRVPDLRLSRRNARNGARRRGYGWGSAVVRRWLKSRGATASLGLERAPVGARSGNYFGIIPKPVAQRSIDPAAEAGKSGRKAPKLAQMRQETARMARPTWKAMLLRRPAMVDRRLFPPCLSMRKPL